MFWVFHRFFEQDSLPILHDEFSGISSNGVDSFSRLLLKTALFVLHSFPSLVASDQGIGPSGCDKTSFMSRFPLYEITDIIPKRFLSAFKMISLSFATIFFDLNVLKDFNFIFGKISKNFIALSPKSLFVKNSTNACSLFSLATNVSVTTSFSGEAPVDKLHRSNASLVND